MNIRWVVWPSRAGERTRSRVSGGMVGEGKGAKSSRGSDLRFWKSTDVRTKNGRSAFVKFLVGVCLVWLVYALWCRPCFCRCPPPLRSALGVRIWSYFFLKLRILSFLWHIKIMFWGIWYWFALKPSVDFTSKQFWYYWLYIVDGL